MNEETLFHLALEKPPSERGAFLNEECLANPECRHRVERLLAEHEVKDDFIIDMSPAGFDTTAEQPIAEGPGMAIGPYKLLEKIGEGGMGAVFRAAQERPMHRIVALKIIKPGMDTQQVIARFEAERQALALMDHPNIARVLDAGTTDSTTFRSGEGLGQSVLSPTPDPRPQPLTFGRPYFVMDLVKGVPITDYCDQNQLTIRERLELFTQVCNAVQHAHQKGIIHRDIKPSNVLVAEYDNQPVPKVIDFGVAKATAQRPTEHTMFTQYGQLIGTFEYMSPEQAKLNQLDIDTRSDIYSLGVLLYELLTGTTPFEKQRLETLAFDETLRIIRDEEPPAPSTRLSSLSLGEKVGVRVSSTLASIAANRHAEPSRLSKDVRGELDWIVMKALEKDRNRRYETANDLAQDIGHYLSRPSECSAGDHACGAQRTSLTISSRHALRNDSRRTSAFPTPQGPAPPASIHLATSKGTRPTAFPSRPTFHFRNPA